jgi:D-alanyl-D-alanine carboxypeptidase
MMTCYVTHRYVSLGIVDWDTEVEVSRHSSSIGGTSARLIEGDLLTIKDLMHGMMLPSGNDAACALAELIGEVTHEGYGTAANYIETFVGEMNRFARHMGLEATTYKNPHGLRPGNKSTCRDIARLGSYLMSEDELAQICDTREYR